MSDYGTNISIFLYKYRQPLYITEPSGERQTFVALRLDLSRSNFNFDLARSDGLDFRLAQSSNGSGVLQMWVAYWDAEDQLATIWFKLPELLAGETRTMYAFWGYPSDEGDSSLYYLLGESVAATGFLVSTPVFLFGDDFDTVSLNTAKWTSTGGSHSMGNSRLDLGTDAYIRCAAGTLSAASTMFIVEEGIYNVGSPSSTTITAHRYRFYGGSNLMGINYYWDGATDRYHNFVYDGTYSTYNGANTGLLTGTDRYAQNYIAYLEDTDHVYQGMHKRGDAAEPIYSADQCGNGAYATASHYTASNYSPDKAFDGNVSTGWRAGDDRKIPWIGYEFVVPKAITQIKIYPTGGTNIRMEGSNSTDFNWDLKPWTVLHDGVVTLNTWNYFQFNNTVAYRFVRLAVYYSIQTEPHLMEIQMMTTLGYTSDLDYDSSWERRVHGNTVLDSFAIYGPDTSAANGVAVDWVVVRQYNTDTEPLVDTRDLYVEYEQVDHQLLDSTEYQPDVTSADYYHESNMGGDPYTMSDNLTGPTSIFTSDGGVISGTLMIDFGRSKISVADADYLHYNDPDTSLYYNADKLSDLNDDVHGRDYWASATSSGWAAIEFPTTRNISTLTLTAVEGKLDRMVKNFRFHGSNTNPRYDGYDDKVLIFEGQAAQKEEPQPFYFRTGATYYKYYILEALDTHGGGNVAVGEWTLHDHDDSLEKKVITQLRLRPSTWSDDEYYFPKQIQLHASNDGLTWVELIPVVSTPTPFVDYAYGRWSRYTFDNYTGYYMYRLTCYDNWRAVSSTMKIAEWEMVETVEESFNIRALVGDSNDINNIWADSDTTIDSGVMYVANDTHISTVTNEVTVESAELLSGVILGHWEELAGLPTDNQIGTGVASASLGPYAAGLEIDKAFDDSILTYYHSVIYSTYPIWIQYQFSEAKRIVYMRMWPRNDYTSRMPGNFIIKGSDTGAFAGEETDIETITGATYPQAAWTEFNFTNLSYYSYYRLHITNKASGSGSGNYMNIFELEMGGYSRTWIEEFDAGIADFNVIL